jgi:hypothetical protein
VDVARRHAALAEDAHDGKISDPMIIHRQAASLPHARLRQYGAPIGGLAIAPLRGGEPAHRAGADRRIP